MSEKTKNYRISNVYSFGYHKELLSYLTFRAEKSLDFILPLIKRDMVVLECGCGPGVVTFEISKKA
ncbi:MAG: hypothetical protein GTO02_20855, partial [Candidatus Dadabacteria bacterium]|nr:hypothetical protein [Candidatus Dadabacteria bacterium]NIQ16741.1 hypothetical protein [Candidatus Dadabacteria bacterium]